MPRHFFSAKMLLTALGILILLAGLSTAYLLRTHAITQTGGQYHLVGDQSYQLQDEDGKSGADELQRFGGTPAVIVAAYKQKLHHLLQSGNLAYLIAVIAVVLAGLCFRSAWEADPAQ